MKQCYFSIILSLLSLPVFCSVIEKKRECIASIYEDCGVAFPRAINLVKNVLVTKNSIKVEVADGFKNDYLVDDFFVSYAQDIDLSSLDSSLLIIPFIMNVYSIILISGKNYYIDSLDIDLYYSLVKVKQILQRLYPKTKWEGNLIPGRLVKNMPRVPLKDPNKEFALLFSGGLDSTTSALSSIDSKILLITLRGHWNIPLDDGGIWERQKKATQSLAKHYGHSSTFVSSNFSEFLNWDFLESLSPEIETWRFDTAEGIGLFGLVVPLLYLKGYSVLRIASSYTWTYPWPSSANPLIDNNILFANNFRFDHDQFDLSRADKIELIIDLVKKGLIERPQLKICDGRQSEHCYDDDCSKCVPTSLMLLALGEDPHLYGFTLDIDEMINRAKSYLERPHLYSTMWELQDLRNKMKKRGYDSKFNWFMEADLTASIAPCKERHLVNWQEFKDLAPAGLVIPDVPVIEIS